MIVYIAGPFTKPDSMYNTRQAIEIAEIVREMGHLPFIPHINIFWHFLYPHNYEYWMDMCFEWLDVCDCLIRLPGDSPGADREVSYMLEKEKPVYLSFSAFLDHFDFDKERETWTPS